MIDILAHGLISASSLWAGKKLLKRKKKKKTWRDSKRWQNAKKECLKRHNYKCDITGKKGFLDVHHKNSASFFPAQRYAQHNLVPIRRNLHKRLHKQKGGFDKKVTKKDYKEFKAKYEEQLFKIDYLEIATIIIVIVYLFTFY